MNELERLRQRQAAIAEELRALNTEIGEGDPTEEQQTRWDALDAEEQDIRTTRIPAEERAARVRESRARFGANITPGRTDDPSEGLEFRATLGMRGDELRSSALRMLDDSRVNVRHLDDLDPAQFGSGDVRAKVEKMLRTQTSSFNGEHFARMLLLTESPHYRSAFRKLMSGGLYFTPEEGRAMEQVADMRAALNITTDTQGGYAVPVLIDPTIIWTGQGHPNDYFQIARVENITTDEWKGVTSAGATAYWTTEGVKATDGAPTLAQPSVVTKKLTVYIPYSIEVGGDWPGFAGEMATAIDLVWNEELVDKFTNGLGTNAQPTGWVTALEAVTASQVASADSGSVTAADVYALYAALPVRYRRTARWMSSTAIENAVRQAGTTDPNFVNTITEEGIGRLMGKPYHENDYMDGVVASTSDSTPIGFGDFKSFLIANRVGLSVENIQHVIDTTSGTPTGQRALYAWGRIGSNVVNPNGMRILSQT